MKIWRPSALLMAVACACNRAPTPETLEEAKVDSPGRSKECADAAERGWKGVEHTSHYNRALGRCLVRIRSVVTYQKYGEVVTLDEIYDAVEGGRIALREETVSSSGETTPDEFQFGTETYQQDSPENRARMGALMEQ
jgi:hypothetical protein